MSDITETQNLFFSAFGQIPDEFKPIVLLSLAGLLIISYYLWKTNNGLISCIRKVIHKDEKLSPSTEINQYEIEIITIKQELDDIIRALPETQEERKKVSEYIYNPDDYMYLEDVKFDITKKKKKYKKYILGKHCKQIAHEVRIFIRNTYVKTRKRMKKIIKGK